MKKLFGKSLVGMLMVLALVVMGLVPAPSHGQTEVDLRYAFFAPPWTFPGMQMQEWSRELQKRVNRRTEGEIQVNVEQFPGSSLLGVPEMYEGTRTGVADVGLGITTELPSEFPLLSVFSLPLKMPNATVASQVVWDIIQEFEPESLDDFKVITAFSTEPLYLQTVEPIRTMEGFEGVDLRSGAAGMPIVEALGISATAMPQSEVPEALDRGIIEGNLSSRDVFKDFNLASQLPYVIDYPLNLGIFVAVMRKQRWEQLPSEVQQAVNELRREMVVWTGAYHDFINVRESMQWSRRNHDLEVIELSEEERQRWDEALEPVIDNWVEEQSQKGIPAQEVVDRARELRDHYSEIWTLQLEE